jgi:hypothetical protein
VAPWRTGRAQRRLIVVEENPVCTQNCFAQVKVEQGVYQSPLAGVNKVALDTGSTTFLEIVAGAMRSNATNSVPVQIDAVADSRMRGAENRVHLTRLVQQQDLFGYSEFLTFPQTVLSPAIECSVAADVQQPFASPLSVFSNIDTAWLATYQADATILGDKYADVCFARLVEDAVIDYKYWRCVDFAERTAVRLPGQQCVQSLTAQNYPCLDTSVQGTMSECAESGTVYAFVWSPTPVSARLRKTSSSWLKENLLLVILMGLGFLLIVALCAYAGKRLHGYRAKYKQKVEHVKQMEEEVTTMEQYGGRAGTKDEEMEMLSNPLVVQMKDMQELLESKDSEAKVLERQQREEESGVRKEHIANLAKDRDELRGKLKELQETLKRQEDRNRAPASTFENYSNAGGASGGGATAMDMGSATMASFDDDMDDSDDVNAAVVHTGVDDLDDDDSDDDDDAVVAEVNLDFEDSDEPDYSDDDVEAAPMRRVRRKDLGDDASAEDDDDSSD